MMLRLKTLGYGAAVSILAAAIAPAAQAQQTTSDITGDVTAEGRPVANATVVVVDTRTSQVRTLTTNAQGGFRARTLPVGGPYTVTVTAPNLQGQTVEDIFLNVSGTRSLDFDLLSQAAGARTLDTVVVTGQQVNLSQLAIGPGSAFGQAELTTLPSISRDLRDTIRLDPRVVIDGTNDDNISCLGGNNRGNAFTIDGVRNSDSFGLNASGFPARNSSPIPFDAIQETSVEFAPFDVTYGNFTGCAINVVTKAGTNDFSGSAFFVYSNDGLFGDSIDGETIGETDFENLNWGATLSGPIIKDRLFFSVAYEQFDDSDFVEQGPAELGFLDSGDVPPLADIEAVESILINEFGFEPGGIVSTVGEENTRVLVRADAIISDQHRLEFTYTFLDEVFEEPDDLGFNDFTFASNFELSGTRQNSYSLRLFSNWTDNFSTEVRYSRNDIEDIQDPLGGGEAQDETPIPRFLVNTPGGEILNGPGFFRSSNELNQTIDQVRLKADYLLGDHKFTAGYELDRLQVFNLFVPNAVGTFEFDSIDDLANRQASEIEANGSFSGDINDAAAEFTRLINTFYIQDEWQVTSDLKVSAGLRYDFFTTNDAPTESEAFVARYGFSNTSSFSGLDAFQPRIGFTYDVPYNAFGETTITGGVGVFTGGDPTVFFSNAFTNFGGGIGEGSVPGAGCTDADLIVAGATGTFGGIPQCVIDQQQAEAALGAGRIDAIDPDLDIPPVTRYNIGFSHLTDFGGAAGGIFDDWTFRFDAIHSETTDALDFVDLTLTQVGVAPDGRPIFNAVDPLLPGCDAVFQGPREGFFGPSEQLAEGGACDAGGDDQDILLTNADGPSGDATTISFQLSRAWDYTTPFVNNDGSFSLNFGYAWSDVENVNNNTSSTATSNFEEVATATLNGSSLANSPLFNRHNVTLSARLEQDFFRDLTTAVTLFYNGRSGNFRSFTFSSPDGGNVNAFDFGDTDDEDRNLLFLPLLDDPRVVFVDAVNGDGEVLQTAAEAEAGFNAVITELGLDGLRCQVVNRNIENNPFFNDLDIRFEQELYTPFEDHFFLFFVDVENFLNLIDDGANVFEEFDTGSCGVECVPLIEVGLTEDGSQFQFSNFDFDGFDTNIDSSIWSVQFGIRYQF